jgi:hypothetical protein
MIWGFAMNATLEIAGKTFDSADSLKERFGFSEVTLHRYMKDGHLPQPIKIAKKRYFDRAEVDRLVLGWK